MTWTDILLAFAVAMWPVWLVFCVMAAVWAAVKLGTASDEYEETPDTRDFDSPAARKYHGDDSVGR